MVFFRSCPLSLSYLDYIIIYQIYVMRKVLPSYMLLRSLQYALCTAYESNLGNLTSSQAKQTSVSGLVVKSIVAIDGPRVRFAADAMSFFFFLLPFVCVEMEGSGEREREREGGKGREAAVNTILVEKILRRLDEFSLRGKVNTLVMQWLYVVFGWVAFFQFLGKWRLGFIFVF